LILNVFVAPSFFSNIKKKGSKNKSIKEFHTTNTTTENFKKKTLPTGDFIGQVA